MSGHRLFRYLAVVSAAAGLACGDYSAITSPAPKKAVNSASPVGAAFSRYILISGAQVCVESCNEAKTNDAKNLLFQIDSLR